MANSLLLLLGLLQTQVTGTVRDTTGRPLAHTNVLVTPGSGPRRGALSDSLGHYRVDSVSAGRAHILFRRLGYVPAVIDTVIKSDENLSMDVVLHVSTLRLSPLAGDAIPRYEAFSLNLFREAVRHAPDSNVVLSPASAAFALTMTYGGSGGRTRTAMAHTLGLDGIAPDQVGPINRALLDSLLHQSDVQLSIANSVWASEGRPFLPTFIDETEKHYHAPVKAVALASPEAMREINEWVAEATHDKIPTLLSHTLSDSDAMVLLNAVYFKGAWQSKFDTAATRPHPFTLTNGRVVNRPLMNREARIQYERTREFQAVRLPYAGDRLAMYVFLPDSGTSLAQFAATMDSAHWALWMDRFSEMKLHLGLPKFRIDYETTLNDPLEALGMGVAFNKHEADFSGMLPRAYLADTNAYISEVRQKTYVDVAEQGTEAAATTSVRLGVGPTAVLRPVEMIVDRPFVAAIRDDRTGLLLFLGAITDPRQR
jgi:serine protease inhibitor